MRCVTNSFQISIRELVIILKLLGTSVPYQIENSAIFDKRVVYHSYPDYS